MPIVLENLILDYAGMPATFFGKTNKSCSYVTPDADQTLAQPLKKIRLSG